MSLFNGSMIVPHRLPKVMWVRFVSCTLLHSLREYILSATWFETFIATFQQHL